MLISQPALFAAILMASLCAALAVVWHAESLGYTDTSLCLLFFACVAAVCLGGVVVCIFWPAIGVIV